MGRRGKNDRKIYDDAIFLVSHDFYRSFTANCDPGAFRNGIANLVARPTKPYLYKVGIHGWSKPPSRRYTALVQASGVDIKRDGKRTIERNQWRGINIHKGGYSTVSSLGCQTIYPSQWEEFIGSVKKLLKKEGQKTIPYLLVENK